MLSATTTASGNHKRHKSMHLSTSQVAMSLAGSLRCVWVRPVTMHQTGCQQDCMPYLRHLQASEKDHVNDTPPQERTTEVESSTQKVDSSTLSMPLRWFAAPSIPGTAPYVHREPNMLCLQAAIPNASASWPPSYGCVHESIHSMVILCSKAQHSQHNATRAQPRRKLRTGSAIPGS